MVTYRAIENQRQSPDAMRSKYKGVGNPDETPIQGTFAIMAVKNAISQPNPMFSCSVFRAAQMEKAKSGFQHG